jgi:hypothetical protein
MSREKYKAIKEARKFFHQLQARQHSMGISLIIDA